MYDALNVLSAMDIIQKQKNHIIYNSDNEFIDDTILPNTKPLKHTKSKLVMSESKVLQPTQNDEIQMKAC